MQKKEIRVVHSSHLDLYWMGSQAKCLDKGAHIIEHAVEIAMEDDAFCFFIETVRFVEYYLSRYPHRRGALKQLAESGRFDIGAAYTDRLENYHDGESMLRNAVYGKKILRNLLGIDTKVCCHPDLPGLSEQTPQMYAKAGVDYYFFARGFSKGARFFWKAPDGSNVVAYNFPIHYAYYSIANELLPQYAQIVISTLSDTPMIMCSAGDLGDADSFTSKTETGFTKVNLREHLENLNITYGGYNFSLSGASAAVCEMGNEGLPTLCGEAPSRWGHGGEAQRVLLGELDRQVAATLYEAELFHALCCAKGLPADIKPSIHPLANRGSSGGKRQYFDLETTPEGSTGWLEYAWRLQMVTQDHNYSGIDGAQNEFDKMLYKKAALSIANSVKDLSLDRLSENIGCFESIAEPAIAVFNCLNWERSGEVLLPPGLCKTGLAYNIIDGKGRRYPVEQRGKDFYFMCASVPSVGYVAYALVGYAPIQAAPDSASMQAAPDSASMQAAPGVAPQQATPSVRLVNNADAIEVSDEYIVIRINKKSGGIDRFYDKKTKTELLRGMAEAGFLAAHSDTSTGVNEKLDGRIEIDNSKNHVFNATIKSYSTHRSEIKIDTSICGCKATILYLVDHIAGTLDIIPEIFWDGVPDVCVRLAIPIGDEIGPLEYGVAYGRQKFGCYIEEPDFFAPDEVDPRLYRRYRKVIGWYARCTDKGGLAIILEHGTIDFSPDGTYAVLLRDTRNSGDNDMRCANEGKLKYRYTFQSFLGSLDDFDPDKKAYARLHPLIARPIAHAGQLPSSMSFFDTGGAGILTTMKQISPEKIEVRLFNETPDDKALEICFNHRSCKGEPVDLLYNPDNNPPDKLAGFEIKTLLFDIRIR